MSCDVAAALFLILASTQPQGAAPLQPTLVSVAQEPLYSEIVRRAQGLKAEVEALRGKPDLGGLGEFERRIGELAALDMKGHLDLAARGVDGDLKCILRGIAEDLPLKLDDLKSAEGQAARDLALREMAYLLDDNAAVILAPPTPPV